METPDHYSDLNLAHRYRVAQANRLVRYCVDQGADLADVMTRRIDFDFSPICGPDGEIAPEDVDFDVAAYSHRVP
jgi:hypothetical protein